MLRIEPNAIELFRYLAGVHAPGAIALVRRTPGTLAFPGIAR